MPRPLRYWLPEGIYHLTVRGNNRQAIFLDSVDYQQYLLELRRCRDEELFRLLAFALMPNHVHLVLQALPGGSPSRVMHRLATRYTRYFNNRYERVGHLHQGRFYSNFVARESYLREVTRYVHLNPVRAGLVVRPEMYPWSSYKWYVTDQPDPLALVEPEWMLRFFGLTRQEQIMAYRRFVEGLMIKEADVRAWIKRLQQQGMIPPHRWLRQISTEKEKCQALLKAEKVPGTC